MRGGMHFSKTGWVAYDDTYRVVAPPWMQALHVANIHSTLGKAAKKAELKHPLTENSFHAKVYLKILVSHQQSGAF